MDIKRNRKFDSASPEYGSIDVFLQEPIIPSGNGCVYYGGLPIDFFLEDAGQNTLLILLQGSVTARSRFPWTRQPSYLHDIGSHATVMLSDPTLYLDNSLTTAWFAGNRHQPQLQQVATKLIAKIAANVEGRKLVFVGGAAASFSALYFSAKFPLSTAVVFNPCTNIARFPAYTVNNWLYKSWEVESLCDLPSHVTVDLDSLYRGNVTNRVFYIQHPNNHRKITDELPFLGQIRPLRNCCFVTEEDLGGDQNIEDAVRSEFVRLAMSTPFGSIVDGLEFIGMNDLLALN
ncbi:hypothetical protein M0E87_08760 [Corynebacterium sp. CCM 9185]|uniref:Uncharacterized protein n=1 Tax=Corynebacterium marambiense TaxID=2765364 RepID=A0ABS0VWM3_9CORY|nr:hypothetical protein [Corynebacterium marambiense]MBI9001186.1 hypothetical protein [Corynebacterium marambiense]MCK7663746.1 hypothetical protein [Corynebacterium marambiense]